MILIVSLAKVMEKESYYLFGKCFSRYFVLLCKVTFQTLFSSTKKQLTSNSNFPILKIKQFHYLAFILPKHPKIPMVYMERNKEI